ncbi:PucR family transcriptional regulator [Streptomyces sp. NPDC127068]|uniref:PucR family transcriptional regulator n=1 Tax=Streptomyces sp. NPDC127068 TaxID=3347127 RepID=UPI00365DA728
MPALDDLVRLLGADLAPVTPAVPPPLDITGVHVSELTDPTPYLAGGELLLTTGMGLTNQTAQARAYTARLVARGVAALGIGLGPVHARVPETLVRACEAVGLPLCAVPAPTPFLTIARTYWSLTAAAGQEELTAALGAHRELVRSAAGPDPVRAVVRTLAAAVEGWAAQLTPQGEVRAVWPREYRSSARRIAAEVARLRVAGPHSSATFPLGDDDVVLHPLTGRGPLSGFVATGCPRPMTAPDRQLVLTACALLALQGEQRRRGVAAARTARACVARLVLSGHLDAARSLGADLGLPAIAPRVRLFAVAGLTDGTDEALDALEPAVGGGHQLLAVAEPDAVWALAEPHDAEAVRGALQRLTAERFPGARAVLGAPASVAELHRQLPALSRTLATVPPGVLRDLAANGTPTAPSLDPILGYRRADLVGAVAAYLRHRGHWERAAADLGVHRNTLRHRIATATRLMGADLDDPDTASRIWLRLRENGLA